MITFIRQHLGRQCGLFLIALISSGYAITRWIHDTEFLAGFWGIKDDEIAVVTIKSKDEATKEGLIEEITIIDPGISLWDGLSVLGVPIILFVLGAWFQQSQQKQAVEEAKEEVLQVYLDRVSALLIDQNLIGIASKEEPDKSIVLVNRDLPKTSNNERRTPEQQELLDVSLDVIRARTLSILRQFEDDTERLNNVMRFLTEAKVISKLRLDLTEARLQGIRLIRSNLKGAKLPGVDLQRANLNLADLQEANLTLADFQESSLKWTNLQRANLESARLHEADLTCAKLQGACLHGAYLNGADLNLAKLQGTDLKEIIFNNKTIWPEKEEVAKAKNVPIRLQRQLGLLPEPPQEQPADQQPPTPPQ